MHHPITIQVAVFEWFPLWGWNHLTSKASNMKEKSVRWCPDARVVRVSCHGNMCVSRMVMPCNTHHSSIDWVEKFLDSIACRIDRFQCHSCYRNQWLRSQMEGAPTFGQCGVIRGSFSSELRRGRTCNYVSFSLQIYTKAECTVP